MHQNIYKLYVDRVKKFFERLPEYFFEDCCPKASSMLHPALKALEEKKFEDVAYFEPFYLKDFVATVSRKNLF